MLIELPDPLEPGAASASGRRRQVEAQDLAARIEMPRVEDQRAVAVVDAGAGAGRRDQPAQDRRHLLRIDREFEAVESAGRAASTLSPACSSSSLSGSMVIALVSTVADAAIGAGDDLALGQQALDAGVDQPGAELVEVQDAGDQQRRAPRG